MDLKEITPIQHPEGLGGGAQPIVSKLVSRKTVEQTSEERQAAYKSIYGSKGVANYLIKGEFFDVAVTDTIRMDNLREFEHFTLYSIVVRHGPFSWTIRKRESEFYDLQSAIAKSSKTKALKRRPPKLPNRFRVTYNQLANKPLDITVNMFHQYLCALVADPSVLEIKEVLTFFGISRYSFIIDLGPKYNEGRVSKQRGGYRFKGTHCALCNCGSSSEQWLIVKQSFLMYVRKDSGEIRAVLLFDSKTAIIFGEEAKSKLHIEISTTYRDLTLKFQDIHEVNAFVRDIGKAICDSSWAPVTENRYQSYAPIRPLTQIRWFVDGRDYFEAVADAIAAATEDIFIEDWWLYPEIHLKRPPHENEEWRLDRLLARKAAEGVKVVVIMYKNVQMAVGINSFYSKQVLKSLHPSISVLRHPDHPPDGIWLWAHHEKICVVDQSTAFIGGIDLCLGRDDTNSHELTDVFAKPTAAQEVAAVSRMYLKIATIDNLCALSQKRQKKQSRISHFFPFQHKDQSGAKLGQKGTKPGREKEEPSSSTPGPRRDTIFVDAKVRAKAKLDNIRAKVIERVDSASDLRLDNLDNEEFVFKAASGRQEDALMGLFGQGQIPAGRSDIRVSRSYTDDNSKVHRSLSFSHGDYSGQGELISATKSENKLNKRQVNKRRSLGDAALYRNKTQDPTYLQSMNPDHNVQNEATPSKSRTNRTKSKMKEMVERVKHPTQNRSHGDLNSSSLPLGTATELLEPASSSNPPHRMSYESSDAEKETIKNQVFKTKSKKTKEKKEVPSAQSQTSKPTVSITLVPALTEAEEKELDKKNKDKTSDSTEDLVESKTIDSEHTSVQESQTTLQINGLGNSNNNNNNNIDSDNDSNHYNKKEKDTNKEANENIDKNAKVEEKPKEKVKEDRNSENIESEDKDFSDRDIVVNRNVESNGDGKIGNKKSALISSTSLGQISKENIPEDEVERPKDQQLESETEENAIPKKAKVAFAGNIEPSTQMVNSLSDRELKAKTSLGHAYSADSPEITKTDPPKAKRAMSLFPSSSSTKDDAESNPEISSAGSSKFRTGLNIISQRGKVKTALHHSADNLHDQEITHELDGATHPPQTRKSRLLEAMHINKGTSLKDLSSNETKPSNPAVNESVSSSNLKKGHRTSYANFGLNNLFNPDHSSQPDVALEGKANVVLECGEEYRQEKEVDYSQYIDFNNRYDIELTQQMEEENCVRIFLELVDNEDNQNLEPIYYEGEIKLDEIEESRTLAYHSFNLKQRINDVLVDTGAFITMEYVYYKGVKPPTKPYPTWVGKDYSNPCTRDFFKLEEPEEDSIDRWKDPRMPWHDIAIGLKGQAARDVARHFIQRFNHVKTLKARDDYTIPFLLPKADYSEEEVKEIEKEPGFYNVTSQILRSSGQWSNGIETERSILNAYISLIEQSEHFIYIENQFFITSLKTSGVANSIGDAIIRRIQKAHEENKMFRVYICMPLMPAFEGDLNSNSAAMLTVMHWQFLSLTRGSESLFRRLDALVGDAHKYITVNCLRRWDKIFDQVVENQIYIHSKLMIVDDKKAICGSANINDRSMLGCRDSEIATIIEDIDFVEETLNETKYLAGKSVYDLRKRLFGEHLGLPTDDIAQYDCVSDYFFNDIWKQTAHTNTLAYDEVFLSLPNNLVTSFSELDKWKLRDPMSLTDPKNAEAKLIESVRGHLVEYPEKFLETEYLGPRPGTKEYYVPMRTFV